MIMKLTEIFETSSILTEMRESFLYHGTHFKAALSILQDDEFKANSYHETSKLNGLGRAETNPFKTIATEAKVWGVSLTRSMDQGFYSGEVVFALDQRKLKQTNKIIPFDFWGATKPKEKAFRGHNPNPSGDKYEFEEFCVNAIKPASRYITAIYMTRSRHNYNLMNFPKYVAPLFNHPLFKII